MKNSIIQPIVIILFTGILLNNSCKEDPIRITKFSSTISTAQISYNTADVKAKLMDVGEDAVSYGHCWATTSSPTTANSKTSKAGSPVKQVDFTSQLSGLVSGTKYFVRAYVVTAEKTIYSEEINFTTAELKDIENNVYKTATIGSQVWMAENLKTTKYSNGEAIGTTIPAGKDISSEITPRYQWAYNGVDSNAVAYGRLYTWYAATDSRNICPTGWHLPADAEYTTLVTALGGVNIAGGKMKEVGISHWESPNTDADNSSGFTARAAGARNSANFYDLKHQAYFWTSTIGLYNDGAYVRTIQPIAGPIYDQAWSQERGYSVRCLKD